MVLVFVVVILTFILNPVSGLIASAERLLPVAVCHVPEYPDPVSI